MPEWAKDLLLALLGSAPILGGIGWLFRVRREDRLAREKKAAEHVEKLQAKVESLLMDAIARERDQARRFEERLAMDAKQVEVVAANTAALKDAAAIVARLERKHADG